MRRDEIIKDLEAEYEVECDPNFDPMSLCDGDTCRHDECDCWDALKNDVTDHLKDRLEARRKRGSLDVWELLEILKDADCELPVFIDGKAIDECYATSDEFVITTKELETI